MAVKNIIFNGTFETDDRWVLSSPAAIVSDGMP